MTTIAGKSVRSRTRFDAKYFYVYMAATCAGVAFVGFAPTYWLPVAAGTFAARPIMHVHGIVFFSWTVFFVFQTWLAASGRVQRHRSIGMIGISFATAMTILGVLAAIALMQNAAAQGLADAGKAFAIVPIISIIFFAITIITAIANIRRPELHKRLMLLAAISILDAPIARWFLTFLAPSGPPGPPPVAVDIPPSLVAFLLLVIAMVFDGRTRGRPHPVYSAGSGLFLALKFLQAPASETAAWHAIATWLLALAR